MIDTLCCMPAITIDVIMFRLSAELEFSATRSERRIRAAPAAESAARHSESQSEARTRMMRTSLFDPLSRMFLMSFLVICILQPSLGDDDMEVDDEPDEVGTINGEMVPEHWPDPIIQNTGDPDADGKAEMVCLIGNYCWRYFFKPVFFSHFRQQWISTRTVRRQWKSSSGSSERCVFVHSFPDPRLIKHKM